MTRDIIQNVHCEFQVEDCASEFQWIVGQLTFKLRSDVIQRLPHILIDSEETTRKAPFPKLSSSISESCTVK